MERWHTKFSVPITKPIEDSPAKKHKLKREAPATATATATSTLQEELGAIKKDLESACKRDECDVSADQIATLLRKLPEPV